MKNVNKNTKTIEAMSNMYGVWVKTVLDSFNTKYIQSYRVLYNVGVRRRSRSILVALPNNIKVNLNWDTR